VDPLFDLSAIEQARGNAKSAVSALERAVDLEPANPETWRRLGRMRLTVLKDPKGALSAFRAALYLDPRSLKAVSDVVVASRLVNAS
jgi:cytochrome c-type biogenesis protein CcmH/NrfG